MNPGMLTAEQEAEWLAVKPGAVVRAPSGRLRIVRRVTGPWPGSKRPPLRTVRFYFTIAHGSWTGRCYTLYSPGELVQLGYTLTGKTHAIKDDFNELFIADTIDHYAPPNFTSVDVIGIP